MLDNFPREYEQYLHDDYQSEQLTFAKVEEYDMFKMQDSDELKIVFTIIVALNLKLQSLEQVSWKSMLLKHKFLENTLSISELCDQAVFLNIENEYTLWSNTTRFSSEMNKKLWITFERLLNVIVYQISFHLLSNFCNDIWIASQTDYKEEMKENYIEEDQWVFLNSFKDKLDAREIKKEKSNMQNRMQQCWKRNEWILYFILEDQIVEN